MKVQICDENTIADYVDFRFEDLSLEEKQEKIQKMSDNLKNGKLDPEKIVCLVENGKIIGIFQWKIDDGGNQKKLSTFGSPYISVPNRRLEVTEFLHQGQNPSRTTFS